MLRTEASITDYRLEKPQIRDCVTWGNVLGSTDFVRQPVWESLLDKGKGHRLYRN